MGKRALGSIDLSLESMYCIFEYKAPFGRQVGNPALRLVVEVPHIHAIPTVITPSLSLGRLSEVVVFPILTGRPSMPLMARHFSAVVEIELSSTGVNSPPTGLCNRKVADAEDEGHFILVELAILIDDLP